MANLVDDLIAIPRRDRPVEEVRTVSGDLDDLVRIVTSVEGQTPGRGSMAEGKIDTFVAHLPDVYNWRCGYAGRRGKRRGKRKVVCLLLFTNRHQREDCGL